MWDRGCRAEILINDPSGALHEALRGLSGDPTPLVTCQLEWPPSRADSYKNKGAAHALNVLRLGQVTTPAGLCLRLMCVARAFLLLNGNSTSYRAAGVKASTYLEGYLASLGLSATFPETGDAAASHRAGNGEPLDQVRYELDRVLSAGGKPVSMQFDDRADQQRIVGFEELYEAPTQLLETYSGGVYCFGVALSANRGIGSTFGTTAYHFEMDQSFGPSLWGHKVTVNHLTGENGVVEGSVAAKMAGRLGMQSTGENPATRMRFPRHQGDLANQDDYYIRCGMVNNVFQSEMSTTVGYGLGDPDFKAFDGVAILNRRHVRVAVTSGSNAPVLGLVDPEESVIMGYQHVIRHNVAKTKLILRRGSK